MKVRSVRQNAFLNTAKQVCQILFPIITIPYVTRILGAQNYGKINFSNSIVNYFILLASLGISSYAIREGALLRDNKKKFSAFADEIFSINIISTIVSYILLFILLLVPAVAKYESIILIQSLSILLTTIGADWVNSVYEDYFYIAIRYIIFQVIAIILLFMFVRDTSSYLAYACILVLATTGGNILNIFYIRRYVKLRFTFNLNWRKHLIPILVLFGNQVAVTLYVNSDITMLGFLSNEDTVGIYSLASKIYTVIQQVLNAILIVSIPRLSYYLGQNKSGEFKNLAKVIQQSLLLLLVPLMCGLFSFSDTIMYIVGGNEYLQGANSLRILAIALIFSLLSGFYTNCVLLPYKLEKKILMITSIAAIVNVLLNFLLIPLAGATGAAITTLISEIIVSVFSYRIASKFLSKNRIIKDDISIIIGGIVVIAICYLFKNIFTNNLIVALAFSIVFSAIGYGIVLLLLRNTVILNEAKKYIK